MNARIRRKNIDRHTCSDGNKHLVGRTVLSQLAGSGWGSCGPGSPLTTCLSKKDCADPSTRSPNASAMLALARQEGARADALSASLQLGGLHSAAGPVQDGSVCRLSRAFLGTAALLAAAVKLCRCVAAGAAIF